MGIVRGNRPRQVSITDLTIVRAVKFSFAAVVKTTLLMGLLNLGR